MAGGHATFGGVTFQSEVGAWMAALVLTERAAPSIGPGVPVSLQLEAVSAVDDVIVKTDLLGGWFINVKTEVTVSKGVDSQLSSVVDQFVRQWILGWPDDTNEQRQFRRADASRDRLVLVLKEGRSRNFIESITPVLQRITDNADGNHLNQIAHTNTERSVLEALQSLIEHHWQRQVGSQISAQELRQFLSIIKVIPFALVNATRTSLEVLLSEVVPSESSSAAVDALVQVCAAYATNRSGGTAPALRAELRARSIPTKGLPKYQSDIARLQSISKRTLDDIAHYGFINIADDNSAVGGLIVLKRDCIEALAAAAKTRSFLLIGDPGSGKSGALQAAARKLASDGHPVVVLAVDQLLTSSSLELLRAELGLTNPVCDVLAEWESDITPILLIDALDASRGGGSEAAISQLLREIKRRAPHWNVIASIRKFDLRYGAKFQGIFEGDAVDKNFVDPEFKQISHLNVPQLTDAEISQVCLDWPKLQQVLNASGQAFRSLLRSPFNLYLLAQILRSATAAENSAKTQLDLLRQYWRRRVEGSDAEGSLRNFAVLSRLVDAMLRDRRLTSNRSEVPSTELGDLARMLHEGVLYQPTGTQRVAFAHHMLFDFSLAKLRLLSDGPTSINKELAKSSEDMLLVAPAAILAFRMTWEDDNTRSVFWAVATDLANDLNTGAFIRALPAKVAVESAQTLRDVEVVIESLRDASKARAATFLLKHMFGVILARIIPDVPRYGSESDPWGQIAQAVCQSAIQTFIWPINAIISQWSENAHLLTHSQLTQLNVCARLLLDHQTETIDFYNEGAVSAAISGIVASFSTNPSASSTSLRRLLVPDRVAARGHKELFWLASNFRKLAVQDAQLAADFLISAYLTPLPSADETTSIGSSRIMSLTSNKRQDFQGVLHMLHKCIGWFLLSAPNVAGKALRDVLDTVIPTESGITERHVESAAIGGRSVNILRDHSCVWWNEDARHHEGRAALLDELSTALKESQANPNKVVFTTLTEIFLRDDVWSAVVSAFLKALRSDKLLDLALTTDLLASDAVLTMVDTSYQAGELLKSAFPQLSPQQRTRIESAILLVEDDHRKTVLAGCLQISLLENAKLRAYVAERAAHDELSVNRPAFSLTTGWGAPEDNWWLKSEGVDLNDPIVIKLLNAAELVSIKDIPQNDDEALEWLKPRWPLALNLIELLDANVEIHHQLRNQVADAVAETCLQICNRCESSEQINNFQNLRASIERCLRGDLAPALEIDEETEEQFAKSASWGRPAARIPAAGALMAFIRANGSASPRDFEEVVRLARDPAVAIRHTILSRANAVCIASPELARALASIAFDEERNEGVLTFFLGAFQKYMGRDVEWEASKILDLEASLPANAKLGRDSLMAQLVGLILRLWLTWDIGDAEKRIFVWANSPLEFSSRVTELIGDLRNLVTLGDIEAPSSRDSMARAKGVRLFEAIISNLSALHQGMIRLAKDGDEVGAPLTEVTRLLDSAAHQLYFGSGAYALSNTNDKDENATSVEVRKRFIREYLPSLRILAHVPYPSVTHPVLETVEALVQDGPAEALEIFFRATRVGGQDGGYVFESLGADLVVKMARRFLADYPAMLSNDADNRRGMVEVLDLFADKGWPEARKLVYELPEMLR